MSLDYADSISVKCVQKGRKITFLVKKNEENKPRPNKSGRTKAINNRNNAKIYAARFSFNHHCQYHSIVNVSK